MKVGFIGLGGIGKHMAINIAKADFDLTVTDLRESPLKELETHGAHIACNPREVAESADIILSSLPSNEASIEVALGSDGVLNGTKNGDIYIELSTISPEVVHSIASEAESKNVSVLDAPVSGGLKKRQEGLLTVMVGGDTKSVTRAMPVFEAFGNNIFHVGESGSGATIKLINNLLCGINYVSTMEALVLGAKSGLDIETLRAVISQSSGNSYAFEEVINNLSTRSPEPPQGEIATQGLHTIGKDVILANEMAQNMSVPLSVGSSALQPLLAGLANGWAHKEYWVILKLLEQLSGVEVMPRELQHSDEH